MTDDIQAIVEGLTEAPTRKVYDKTGREIMAGDVVKVFHFIGARRKRYYMYKLALGAFRINPDGPFYMRFSHIDMTENYYHERMEGQIMHDYEIVQGLDTDFTDRPRLCP